MGVPTKQDWREARRRRAWELHEAGWTQKDIAQALGVTEGAVSQWMKRGREQGLQGLASHPAPGPPSRLSRDQRAQLPDLLKQGAEAFGFQGKRWTSKRVAVLIEREFGVHYHPDHVRKVLRGIRWSPQQPKGRASQRNEAAITDWKQERWPALKKKPRMKDARSSS